MEDLITDLYDIGAIKITAPGKEITLRSGEQSPLYIDLRRAISFPLIFKRLTYAYSERVRHADLIAGVPMGGIPFATAVALDRNLPLILPRKDTKSYGLETKIEGSYQVRDTVCLIEDIMTTGHSVYITQLLLQSEKLDVKETIAFLWYYPQTRIPNVKTLTTLETLLETLCCKDRITRDTWFRVLSHFRKRKSVSPKAYPDLFRDIVERKRSRLIVALDVSWKRAQELIPDLAPFVCAFKFHYDLFSQDFDPEELMKLAEVYDFLVIRDRKCADVAKTNKAVIGSQGKTQHVTIVHALPGAKSFPEGPLIVVLEMNTEDSLFTPQYIRKTLEITRWLPAVLGYVSQHRWWEGPRLCFTPGINLQPRLEEKTGQRYSRPRLYTDLFIVGSAITKAEDPVKEAKKYQDATWRL